MLYRVVVSPAVGQADPRAPGLLAEIASLGIDGVEAVETADLYFVEGDLDGAALERLGRELLADPVVQRYAWEDAAGCANPPSNPPSPRARGRADGGEGSEAPSAVNDGPQRELPGAWVVEVAFLPGVTDAVASSLLEGARLIGVEGLTWAATGQRYVLHGSLDEAQVQRIARSLLSNEVIQTFCLGRITPGRVPAPRDGRWVETIPLRTATPAELARLSRERLLSLDPSEMAAIQRYFSAAGRDPTDVELEALAQTWSEHCVHKTFKAVVNYEEYAGDALVRRERIDGLLRTFIRAATEEIAAPWVRSAFADNAGIVDFDERHELSFKVETHNHPSALEPFGGANTGVGGVVRDIIGVSARPIANTDVLCFGPGDLDFSELPGGVLHPRRVRSGVVAGIEDYGNKMGIPTVNGAIVFHPGYTANPLVYCGCLGIAPVGRHRNRARPGDRALVIGGRTGRDGLHGATFSSAELTHETGAVAGGAVQIGNPITEKLVLEVVMEARDRGLYTAITDCGAGGLSSAVGEMGREVGVTVQLEDVPLKYQGLRPWEIWLSEAQERMVLAVPPERVDEALDLCRRWDVEATVIGTFRDDGRLVVRYGDETVADLAMDFLHDGLPRRELSAVWRREEAPQPPLPASGAGELLLRLLADPDIASKEAVIRRYDHEVQGATIVKPLSGPGDGPSDAAVLVPQASVWMAEEDAAGYANPPSDMEASAGARGGGAPEDAAGYANLPSDLPSPSRTTQPPQPLQRRARGDSEVGGEGALALSCGLAPRYGARDPYAMAWAAVDEAIRNAVAVGADPARIALLDNFCWGSPERPEQMGALVQAARACHDAALAYRAPFISGKDSLNNEYGDGHGGRTAIPPTLLISALGILPGADHAVTMDLKEPGDALYVVGETRLELGESYLHRHLGLEGGAVPQPVTEGPAIARALHTCIRSGLVRACHDCSEGGLAVAAAEMALAGGLGLALDLTCAPRTAGVDCDLALLFAETGSRYLVEVRPEDEAAFAAAMEGLPCAAIGRVQREQWFVAAGLGGGEALRLEVGALRRAWKGEGA